MLEFRHSEKYFLDIKILTKQIVYVSGCAAQGNQKFDDVALHFSQGAVFWGTH